MVFITKKYAHCTVISACLLDRAPNSDDKEFTGEKKNLGGRM